METATWTTPLLVAGMSLMALAAMAHGRRFVTSAGGGPRFLAGGLAAMALVILLVGPVSKVTGWPPGRVLRQLAGAGLLVGAGVLAMHAARARTFADALRSKRVTGVDEAIAQLRQAGRDGQVGVFRGHLTANEGVTSPGGIVCAFFDAELRAVAPEGQKGRLLSSERASARVLSLRGEDSAVRLRFDPSALHAAVSVRRCHTRASPSDFPSTGVLVGPTPVAECMSHERVGKLGEPCVVVGELRHGAAPGSFQLQGERGRPALVVTESNVGPVGERYARRAWVELGGAAGLVATAACVMSGRV